MAYDFDTITDRRNTQSLKWEVGEGELPMWVADMDFRTAPEITAALQRRVDHGVFGYSVVPEEWYRAYTGWWEKRHGFCMEKEWLNFTTGVVPAISSAVRKLTTAGEHVLVQTPVYNIFFNSIVNNGRNVLESRLKFDGTAYGIDFGDLERKLSDPQTAMMILCNPHNPVGRIWSREELEKIGDLCAKYHVVVVSDEIHCDLTDPGRSYVPFASVSEACRKNSITCIAPTKAFNLAGLQTAAVMAADETLRHKMYRALNTDEVAEPNAFAVTAAVAAFTEGGAWLDELKAYLYENKRFAREYLERELPAVGVVLSDATYLLWLDCRKISGSAPELARFLRRTVGLYLSAGDQFGGDGCFLRMNAACPRKRLEEGLGRFAEGIRAYERWSAAQC